MYELRDPCTLMFFYNNKHMMIDHGTGNNNKHMMIDHGTGNNNKFIQVPSHKSEIYDLCEVVYRGGKKGFGQVDGPKNYAYQLEMNRMHYKKQGKAEMEFEDEGNGQVRYGPNRSWTPTWG